MKVVVIGGGLGGLQSGIILAQQGLEVTIVEQSNQLGGCLQSYIRQGVTLDTGFHYVGGIEHGQPLYPILERFNLLDLDWQKLDSNAADIVYVEGKKYAIPQGYDNFVEQLSSYFPEERQNLKKFVHLLQNLEEEHFECGAIDYINSTFEDQTLKKVLLASSLRVGLNEKTPLFVYGCITNSYIQSAYRLNGGGGMIINRLRQLFEELSGKILTHLAVKTILEQRGAVKGVELANGERIEADIVVSDISPSATISLLEQGVIRAPYRKRINSLPLSEGVFTTTLLLDNEQYINSAIHLTDELPQMIHFYPHGKAVDLMTSIPLNNWVELRQNDYDQYCHRKELIANKMIDLASAVIPSLKENIKEVYTSSPATYERYLLAQNGSAYGPQRDYRDIIATLLSPKTPLKGLYLTGQGVHLHGFLGVSMTALQTTQQIIQSI